MHIRVNSACFLVIALSGICGMCSKDDTQPAAPAIRNTTGLLATIAVNSVGRTDTLCFRFSSTGAGWDITDLSPTARSGGFLVKPRDIVQLSATSSGHWTFKNNGAYFLRIGSKELRGGNTTGRHHLGTTRNSSDSAQFVANDAGNGTFYIESALHRGLYMILEPPDVQPPTPFHSSVRFDGAKKQKWFIVPW